MAPSWVEFFSSNLCLARGLKRLKCPPMSVLPAGVGSFLIVSLNTYASLVNIGRLHFTEDELIHAP